MRSKGVTLIELLIVISIVAILAGLSVPLIQGRVDDAKWSEANTAAGVIRRAATIRFADGGTCPLGKLNDAAVMDALAVQAEDLEGSYFGPGDYEIVDIDEDGRPVVQVTGTRPGAPEGSRVLHADGSWSEGVHVEE